MVQDDEKTIEQLNEEADIAADYLEGLLDVADYEGDIEMGVRNNRPMVQIVADDDTDIKHLIVDVDGFLKRRRQILRDMALDAVDDVRETGEPVDLKPMNSFERKIIHDVVRDEGLRSRSHGEEPKRYVTVYLKHEAVDDDEFEDDEEYVVED